MSDSSQTPRPESRFEKISTPLRLLDGAHRGDANTDAARNDLALLYVKAIRSYLGALLRNDHDADELAQDVLVKLLKNEIPWEPYGKGRFRDYLKTVTRNAALNYLRAKRRHAPVELNLDQWPEVQSPDPWLVEWRRLILAKAYERLERYQSERPGNCYATLLRIIQETPKSELADLALRLAHATGRRFTAVAIRQQVHRARRKLAQFLREEVRRTLRQPTDLAIHEELEDLGLADYVQRYLGPTA